MFGTRLIGSFAHPFYQWWTYFLRAAECRHQTLWLRIGAGVASLAVVLLFAAALLVRGPHDWTLAPAGVVQPHTAAHPRVPPTTTGHAQSAVDRQGAGNLSRSLRRVRRGRGGRGVSGGSRQLASVAFDPASTRVLAQGFMSSGVPAKNWNSKITAGKKPAERFAGENFHVGAGPEPTCFQEFRNVSIYLGGIVAVEITMKELLEAGVHFGHQTRRWNPKMKEYIFGERNGIHIIDLQKTLKMFREASRFVSDISAQGRTVLFVGTKRQAQEAIAEEAKRCGAYFVNHRWLGGTLTNWSTLQKSIKRLKLLKAMTEDGRMLELSKKERARLDREMKHLLQNLEGIENMAQLPDAMFVVDSNAEEIAVKEARRMGIPVVSVVDTNCDPDMVDWIIPGNDDALRAIRLFTTKIADSVAEGNALYEQSQVADQKLAADQSHEAASTTSIPAPTSSTKSRKVISSTPLTFRRNPLLDP